jgi:hypothetical protein
MLILPEDGKLKHTRPEVQDKVRGIVDPSGYSGNMAARMGGNVELQPKRGGEAPLCIKSWLAILNVFFENSICGELNPLAEQKRILDRHKPNGAKRH